METPQQVLTRLGIPTHSYIRAALVLGEWDAKSVEFYVSEISNLLGEPTEVSFQSSKVAHLFFCYYVQEIVKVMQTGSIPNMEKLWDNAQHKATVFMKTFPFSTTERQSTDDVDKPLPWRHTATQIFIDKKDQLSRKQLVDLISSTTGISTSSCQQFVIELLKKHNSNDECVSRKGPAVSLEVIDSCYNKNSDKPKDEILQEFLLLGLSTASSSSHFYRCKKTYGHHYVPIEDQKNKPSNKHVVYDALTKLTADELLKRNWVCDKLSADLGFSKNSIQTYYYQFLKERID